MLQLPAHREDEFVGWCFDWGCTGLSQILPFQLKKSDFEASPTSQDFFNLHVYFESHPKTEFFEELGSRFHGVIFSILAQENRDWLEEWKKDFKPFRLVDNIWVIPSWLDVPSGDIIPLRVDPGLAFGTGTHATTQLSAHLIQQVVTSHTPRSLLDVGTGTAILAMVAHHFGVKEVFGIEIDPMARETARENLALNKIKNILILDSTLGDLNGRYDCIVANIIDGVLLEMAPDFNRLLAPNGILILCGILVEREESFLNKFLEVTDLKLITRLERDDWVAIALRR